MSATCELVDRFADGQLPEDEARAFESHLVSCPSCQARLFELVHLDVLSQQAAAQRPPTVIDLRARLAARRWIPLAMAASLTVLVGGGAALLARRQGQQPPDLLASADHRSLEARLSHPGASRFLPYSVPRAAGGAGMDIPQRILARLEEQQDFQGLAAAHLLQGAPALAERRLAQAGDTPDVYSDRAALALERQAVAEAVTLTERALRAAPGHPQALWNRALALRALGLTLSAAEDFDAVAARGEPGWSGEARQRADPERQRAVERRRRWEAVDRNGREMVSGGAPFTVPENGELQGYSRLLFYDAVRAAPTRARVEGLLPIAVQLDQHFGGDVLQRYVRRVVAADFSARAPLAEAYGRLATGQLRLDRPGAEDLLKRIRAAGQEDLELGALVFTGREVMEAGRFRTLAERSGDPWFQVMGAHVEGDALASRGELYAAETRLLSALRACSEARMDFRCVRLELSLAGLYLRLHRLEEAQRHAGDGLKLARSRNEWALESALLGQLGEVSGFQEAFAVGRAYLREMLLRRPDDCETQRYVHRELAAMAMLELDPATMAAEAKQIPTCGRRLDLKALHVLSNVARLGLAPEAAGRLQEELAALRAIPTTPPAELALADHMEGRATIERDPAAGRALLERSIAKARALPRWDAGGRKAQAYSYAVLAIEAGRRRAFGEALQRIADDLGVQDSGGCVLGIAADAERIVLAVRGARGDAWGLNQTRTSLKIDPATLVPAEIAARLEGCPRVDVLAQPPVQGLPRILPPGIAWGYRLSGRQPAAGAGAARPQRLVVSGVEPPPSLGLKPLRTWDADAGPSGVHLRGPEATPSRVLKEMAGATEIEFHVHGQTDWEQVDTAHLVLSPDQDGRYLLGGNEIRDRPLRQAPLVILAACEAGATLPWQHEGWSLPAAFLQAGARAVLASPSKIDDRQAGPFFDAIREQVRTGVAPANALQAERARWLAQDRESWTQDVLLFE